jgi:hypothetical protein
VADVGYCPTLPLSAIQHLRPHLQTESFLDKTYWRYQHQPQCIWQLKSCSFERSILICHKFNSNFVLKDSLLACKNFDFLKTHRSSHTLDAIHFTSTVTCHNWFSVMVELSSHVFCKTAAPVMSRRGYLELPDLSEYLLPSYNNSLTQL